MFRFPLENYNTTNLYRIYSLPTHLIFQIELFILHPLTEILLNDYNQISKLKKYDMIGF
jgi:hypothetical protein